MQTTSYSFETPAGRMTLESDGQVLTFLSWKGGNQTGSRDPLLQKAAGQLQEYFQGTRKTFNLPYHARGTPLQIQIWRALQDIPYGAVVSYGELAREVKTHARAIGMACGRNTLPIFIPCHRIVASNGPGGYSAGDGLATKQWLLNFEKK